MNQSGNISITQDLAERTPYRCRFRINLGKVCSLKSLSLSFKDMMKNLIDFCEMVEAGMDRHLPIDLH